MRTLALFAFLSLSTSIALAQRGGAVGVHAGGHTSGRISSHAAPDNSLALGPLAPGFSRLSESGLALSRFGSGFDRSRLGRSRSDRNAFPYSSLAFPFFDDLDSDDIYSTGYPVSSALPPFVSAMRMHRAEDLLSGHENSSQSSQPLMIELQNGRYVRVNHAAIGDDAETVDGQLRNTGINRAESLRSAASPANSPSAELPPATLIFRDGHKEEVRDYAIANGTLYARGDFYVDGYWNRNIQLSTLDIPQTLQANAANGVKFLLPSSPNEVITRP